MRILVVSRAFPGHGGGGMEVAAWDLMQAWAAAGHEVVGLTTPGGEYGSEQDFSVTVLPGAAGTYSPEWFSATARYAADHQFDVIFGVSAGAHEIVKTSDPGRIVVMQAHGTSLEEARSALSLGPLRGAKHALGQIPGMLRDWNRYPLYDALVAVGPGIVRTIEVYPSRVRPRRVELIENGIALPAAEETDVSAPSAPYAVFVGRLGHDKGPDLAVEALQYWPGHLVIVGSGSAEDEVRSVAQKAGVQDRVHLVSRRRRGEIAALLPGAIAVVAPSRRREGLPLVALEALAAGRPLVTSESVGLTFGSPLPEGVIIGGLVPRDIAAGLHRSEQLVATGNVRLPDKYRLDVSAHRYIELFEALLDARR